MPVYEYECTVCGSQFEERRPVAERDHPVTCPNCGERKGQRVTENFAGVMMKIAAGMASGGCGGGTRFR